jgi:hypothetical protein
MSESRTDDEGSTAEQAEEVSKPRRNRGWRRIVVSLLVIIGCVLAPLSVLGVWVRNTMLDTDQYVETVGPLIDNPDVQDALATRITTAVVEGSGIEEKIADALPSQASFVAPAVADGLEQVVHRTALQLVQSDEMERLWDTVNRRAHTQVVALLEGTSKGDKVTTSNGNVVVHLGPLVGKVHAALEKRGVDVFDESDATRVNKGIVLIKSDTLESAQDITDLLQKLAYVLPLLTLLAFALAIGLSRNRRRTILRSALGLALAMGLLLVVFNVGRHLYLSALPSTVNESAAAAVYDQLLSFLRLSLRTAFVLALIIAFAAWISGPGHSATRFRNRITGLAHRHDAGTAPSGIAVFVGRYKTALRVTVIGIALAILVVLNAPTPAAVLILAILVVLGLLLIEFLGRAAPASTAESSGE